MATYLPNSNDYIPKSKSYTPDFKFLADVLGRRQDRYNTNYKQLNELYGKVVHADLSHEQNIHKRDEYANLLVPKIQQLTGTDFSLQQNADAARALFKPFFEDKTLVRDMVYTKRFDSQMAIAENQKTSPLKETRDKFFEDGVKRLNYSMQDFQEGSLDDIMSAEMPEYVENPDLIHRGIEYLKNFDGEGKGLEVSDIIFGPDGKWMVHQTNGSLLTHKPTGLIDPDTEEMTYYNPAANYISTTMADDPIIARGYATTAYVRAREFYDNEDNIAKYGSKEGAERFYWADIITKSKTQSETIIKEEEEAKIQATKTKNGWDNYLKTNPNQNTEDMQDYVEALSAIAFIEEGINKQQTVLSNISRDGEDINELRSIGYQAFMYNSISRDILASAAEYADLTKKITKRELNPLYEKEIDYQYKASLKKIELDNAKALADYTKAQTDIGLNLGGAGGLTSGAPHAAINADSYTQEDDKIGANKEFINSLTTRPILSMLSVVEKAYGDLGPGWSSDDNVFKSDGMEVEVFAFTDESRGEGVEGVGYMTNDNPTNRPGKWETRFMKWPEAKEYFLGQGRKQEDLNTAYQDVMARYRNVISSPNMKKPMFAELNKLISTVENQIKNDKLTIIDLIENQGGAMDEAYKLVLKNNPEIAKQLQSSGSMMTGKDGEKKLLSLPEFKKQNNDEFNKRVKKLNLPRQLKTQDQFVKELLASPKGRAGEYTRAGHNIKTPLHASSIYHRDYLLKLFPKEVTDQFGGVNYMELVKYFYAAEPSTKGPYGGKKPPHISQDIWDKSVAKVVRNETYYFPKTNNDTKMILSSNNDFSALNRNAEKLYNTTYDAMNTGMISANANAQNGFPTYDARRDYMLKNQGDDGSIMMTDNWEGSYWHGDSKKDVTDQIALAFTLLNKLDRSFTSVKSGTSLNHVNEGEPGALVNKDWDNNMEELLKQITMDLENPQEVDKAHRPNMHVTYNENVNGMSGLTIQLDQKYVNKLKSNTTGNKLLALEELQDNTFTIYIDKDKYAGNPMNMANMYVSNTRREIKTNGQYYHEVPEGGSIKAWKGTDGNIYTQMTQQMYSFENKRYESVSSTTEVLNISDKAIDALMENQRQKLNKIAEDNRLAKDKNTQ